MSLLERYRAGDRRALARLISLIERGDPAADAVLAALTTATPRVPVIGLTGPPGAGKSTLISALIAHWRAAGESVAVLAIDPSSARSGGAALGDRLRMAAHATDAGVFIRSMASRGRLGGLADAAAAAVTALAAFGFDHVVVETVGVGQAEIEVAALADVVVVIQVPGLGDEMQALKAGLLEVADLIVVNKADRPGASLLASQLRQLAAPHDGPPPPVLLVTATTGSGVAELAAAIATAGGGRRAVRQTTSRALLAATLAAIQRRLQPDDELTRLTERVNAGELTLEQAVDHLLAGLGIPPVVRDR